MKKYIFILALICMLISCKSNEEEKEKNDVITETSTSDKTEEEVAKFTVTFFDENGNTLKADEYTENQNPEYLYEVNDTIEWDYSFLGWATSQNGEVLTALPKVSADANYYAIVNKVKQKYTVSFATGCNAVVDSVTLEYGSSVDAPVDPVRQDYLFVGWSNDQNGTEEVSWPFELKGDCTLYAIWNEKVDMKSYLSSLLSNYQVNITDYIPETMLPNYEGKLVMEEEINYDFTQSVSVNKIIYGGYGEQWNMIANNILESQRFHSVLKPLETVITSSVVAFNNWFDSNTTGESSYSTAIGDYNVSINFEEGVLHYVLEFNSIQVHMQYDVEGNVKTVRIQLSDANALKYIITDNSYEFAIRYAGVRRAYFKVSRDEEDNVSGEIYEYLGLDGSVSTSSAAHFYSNEEYTTAVGNKAGALIGFAGNIVELYSTEDGELLAYEVQETLSKIVYNTLWFNLDNVSGINSIKLIENTEIGLNKNPHLVYVNGSSQVLKSTDFGGINFKTASRRYDIELRTQYFYSYDQENDTYVSHAVKVPMLFVQEEKLADFNKDFKDSNNLTATIDMNASDLAELQSAYVEDIPSFVEGKEKVTVEEILTFIGEKYTFE